jgi:hypothetical protein
MRIRLMHLGIAALVLSWGWAAEAQLQPPPRPPFSTSSLEIEGPAIGGSISASAPVGVDDGSVDVGFHMELPIAHTASFRADVGFADWNVPDTSSLARTARQVALARGTFAVVVRPHSRPGLYLGFGFGVFRYALRESTVRRAPGGTLLGGVELPITRKLVMGLELQGHFIDHESRGIPAELSIVGTAAIRMQWRY